MKVHLRNLQSYIDLVIELEKGVPNVLRGPNETGKSTILKGFSYCFLGSDILGTDFRETLIRVVGDHFMEPGSFMISEGDISMGFRITRTFTVYIINGREYQQEYPPQEILDWFRVLKLDDMILNIINKHTPRFLLDPNPVKNGNLLVRALSNTVLDSMQGSFEDKLKEIKEIQKNLERKETLVYEQSLGMKYRDISIHKVILKQLEENEKKYRILIDVEENLKNFKAAYRYVKTDLDRINNSIDSIESQKYKIEALIRFKREYIYNPIDLDSLNSLIYKIEKSEKEKIYLSVFKKGYVYGAEKAFSIRSKKVEKAEEILIEYDKNEHILRSLKDFKKEYRYGAKKKLISLNIEIEKEEDKLKVICPNCGTEVKVIQ